MTKDEFRKKFDESFWTWVAGHDRVERMWWLSLEDYAKHEWDRAYHCDLAKVKEDRHGT